MKGLTKVLFGELNPTGKQPDDPPEAGNQMTAQYAFGHRLSWETQVKDRSAALE